MGSRRRKKRKNEAPTVRRGRKSPGVWVGLLLVVIAVGSGLWLLRNTDRVGPEPLNLVLVSIDTLRPDYLSCYGSSPVPTPNVDRLADDGTLFEQVQTVAPTTLPAHASLFTGVTPLRHGVRDNVGFYLSNTTPPTLASILNEAGYRTGGFVGAFVLDSRFGIDRGFEVYFDRFDAMEDDIAGRFVSQRRGGIVLDEALGWMETTRSEPFFTFIHFYDPHTPYDPPPPFTPPDRNLQALYGGEIAYVDSLVGRLIEWLDDNALLDETIVVVTSDHGESLGEHGEQTHGFFVYEATLRVPLIIRYPEGEGGRRITERARLTDVAPTLLDLLRLPISDEMEGRSLLPLMENSDRSLELTAYAEAFLPRLHYGWSELRSFRKGPYKLIMAPRSELYDLERDPGESHNLYHEKPEVARELAEELEAFMASRGAAVPRAGALDPATLEKLQALGYAGGVPGATAGRAFSELPDPKDRIAIYERINDPNLTGVAPNDVEGYRRALGSVRSVLAEDASIPRAHILYGELLLKGGRPEEALGAFDKAHELHPNSFAATYGLATAELALGRLERAESFLRRALEIEPMNTKSYFRLAELEKMRGNLDATEDWLRKALAIHPDIILSEMLAEVLIETGRSAEAEEIVSEVAQRYGEDAISLYNLGQMHLSRGDPQSALETLRRASRMSPNDADIRHALGNALAASGDMEAAVSEYRRAIEISPCFAAAHSNLGTTYLQVGRIDDAIRCYQQAMDCDPDYIVAHKNLASVLLQRGELNRAAIVLREAVRLRPDDEELRRALDALETQTKGRR